MENLTCFQEIPHQSYILASVWALVFLSMAFQILETEETETVCCVFMVCVTWCETQKCFTEKHHTSPLEELEEKMNNP